MEFSICFTSFPFHFLCFTEDKFWTMKGFSIPGQILYKLKAIRNSFFIRSVKMSLCYLIVLPALKPLLLYFRLPFHNLVDNNIIFAPTHPTAAQSHVRTFEVYCFYFLFCYSYHSGKMRAWTRSRFLASSCFIFRFKLMASPPYWWVLGGVLWF